MWVSIVGLGLMAGMVYLYRRRQQLLATGRRVTGRVTGIEWVENRDVSGGGTWYTNVEFSDQSGAVHKVRVQKHGTLRCLNNGDSVDLVYPVGAPQRAVVAGIAGGAPIIGGFIFGLILLLTPFLD